MIGRGERRHRPAHSGAPRVFRGHRLAWRGAAARAAVLALTVGAGGALVLTTPARAADSSFDATASAYGVNNGISNPSFPLNLVLTGSGPASYAHLTSLGGSDAFASFPYPGDTLVGAPGLASGLFGVSFPNYPLYVATSSGDEPKSANYPGIALDARSDGLTSESRALVGADVSGFDSTSRVQVNSDGGVTSDAGTVFSGLDFGGALSLSGVRSLARVVADGNSGKLERTSRLSIASISVPGLKFTVPPQTPGTVPLPIPVPGFGQVAPLEFPPVPVPSGGQTFEAPALGFTDGVFTMTLPGQGDQKYAVPSKPVLDAFAAQGIAVTFQQAAMTDNGGIIAPAITFDSDFPAPPENPFYNGKTHASYTLGGSFAQVSYDVLDAGVEAFGAAPSGGAPAAVGVDSASALPAGEVGAVIPSAVDPVTGAAVTPTQIIATTATARANLIALRSPSLAADTADIYLALIAVGLGVLVTGTILRRLGVLRPWM